MTRFYFNHYKNPLTQQVFRQKKNSPYTFFKIQKYKSLFHYLRFKLLNRIKGANVKLHIALALPRPLTSPRRLQARGRSDLLKARPPSRRATLNSRALPIHTRIHPRLLRRHIHRLLVLIAIRRLLPAHQVLLLHLPDRDLPVFKQILLNLILLHTNLTNVRIQQKRVQPLWLEMVNHVKNGQIKIEIKINFFENERLRLRLIYSKA